MSGEAAHLRIIVWSACFLAVGVLLFPGASFAGTPQQGGPEESSPDEIVALVDAQDILLSGGAGDIVRACMEGGTADRELVLVVHIGADGRVAAVESEDPILPAQRRCLEERLSKIPFMESARGFEVTVRYELGAEKAGVKAAGDPAAWMLVYTQTAFTLKKKEFAFTDIDGGNFLFSFGASDNLTIALNATAPVFVWGLGAHLKYAFEAAPLVRIGFMVNGGVLWPYFWDEYEKPYTEHRLAFMIGGAPLLVTVGSEDLCFNASLHVEEIGIMRRWVDPAQGHLVGSDEYFIFFPDIGGSVKVAEGMKILFEAWTLLSISPGLSFLNGFIWGLMPGVRFYEAGFHFDASIALVLLPDFHVKGKRTGKITAYAGPIVTFGFR